MLLLPLMLWKPKSIRPSTFLSMLNSWGHRPWKCIYHAAENTMNVENDAWSFWPRLDVSRFVSNTAHSTFCKKRTSGISQCRSPGVLCEAVNLHWFQFRPTQSTSTVDTFAQGKSDVWCRSGCNGAPTTAAAFEHVPCANTCAVCW